MTTPSNQPVDIWPLRRVGLKVLNLSTCLDYYTRLGLTIVRDERTQGSIGLGNGAYELLTLRLLPGGHPRPARTAGLFHFALLVRDEIELGSFLQHCRQQHIPLEGASDHLVSQALYLRDPEGNGIEVYADRPRENWQWTSGHINMATLPLDMAALLKQAQPFDSFSSQTRLGHMHLNVGDLDRSQAFYQSMGMELTAGLRGQAYFLSWDGYHHHLAINLWAGRRVAPVKPDVSGLDFFEIARPPLSTSTLEDPDGMIVVVSAPTSS